METKDSLYALITEIAKDLKAGKKSLEEIAEELGEAADVAYDLAKKEDKG